MDQRRDAETRRFRLVVALACLLLVLQAVLVVHSRGLWAPDELRYAQVVQGMAHGGNLFVPELWDNVYTEKPPLFFWLARLATPFTGGVRLVTLLIPILLAACILLWLTGHIASRWYGARTGIIATLVLVTLPLFLLLSLIGRMDMLLALFVTGAAYSFYRGYVECSRWSRVWAFAWMGLGLLAKGPFGVVFPLGIVVTALVATGKLRRLWCRESLVGSLVLVSLLATWLVPATSSAGTNYVGELLSRQVIARAVSGLDHRQPAYFYVWVLAIILLPWVVFVVPSLRASWRKWRETRDERECWLLCWVLVPLLVLSLVREKLPVYLLPAMPPIAILIGRHWAELFIKKEYPASMWHRVGPLFVLGSVVGAVALVGGMLVELAHAEPGVLRFGSSWRVPIEGEALQMLAAPRILLVGGVLFLGLALVGWASLFVRGGRRLGWTFGTLAAVAPCGHLFLTLAIMPSLDASQSWRAVAEALVAAREPGEPIVTCGMRPFLAYYLNEDLESFRRPEALAEFVQSRGSAWCAAEHDELEGIKRHCLVDSMSQHMSPGGPVYVVHLRPLVLAEQSTQVEGRRRD